MSDTGYDLDDPKHPDFAATLADRADDRRTQMREGGA